MLLALSLALVAHVPTYDGCVENCCVPPHPPSVSQVVYLRGSGGLELHTDGLDPVLHVDATFRDDVDPSTFDLHVGCGGCVASTDPILTPPVVVAGLGDREVEPFTQTAYRSARLPSDVEEFDTTALAGCAHFSIRLVDHGNSSHSPIVWGAVVGLAEAFTVEELLLFPVYILRNHGDRWNEMGWTVWVWMAVGAPVLVAVGALAVGVRRLTIRGALYALALVGFVGAAGEELTHLVYAQRGAPVGYGLWVGLFVVIGVAQGLGIAAATLGWSRLGVRGLGWAVLEAATGVALLFVLGAGFYAGPAALVLAAAARARDTLAAPAPAPSSAAAPAPAPAPLRVAPAPASAPAPPPPPVACATSSVRPGLTTVETSQVRQCGDVRPNGHVPHGMEDIVRAVAQSHRVAHEEHDSGEREPAAERHPTPPTHDEHQPQHARGETIPPREHSVAPHAPRLGRVLDDGRHGRVQYEPTDRGVAAPPTVRRHESQQRRRGRQQPSRRLHILVTGRRRPDDTQPPSRHTRHTRVDSRR